MRYASHPELPPSVRRSLPMHAQDVHREAFNHSFSVRAGDRARREASLKIAWRRSNAPTPRSEIDGSP